ncbi:MAG: cupin-like domain-containing protein [Planctomycetes bacterium]|nr:cupin-like domain-containing protein [Planctomycetota bacterium]
MMIDRLAEWDRKTLDRHVRGGLPFVVPGFARHWPACKKWTPEHLATTCGTTPIPVSHYPDGVTLASKVKMTVRDYLAAISATPDSWKQHYMESVELSELSEELYQDVPIPADLDDLPGVSDTVFFGLNTGSCCHIHAHEEAVVFQIMGTKVFSIYPPADVRNLYFEPVTADYRRSRVAFPDVDYRQFPLARRLTRIDVTLQPGDVLYLPVHWAHWTAAEGFTFTLTRFFEARLRDYCFPSPGIRCVLGRLIQLIRDRK